MTEAKNIYSSGVDVRALKFEPEIRKPIFKKSILSKVVNFLIAPDLDLETFERLEGVERSRDCVQYLPSFGRRF